MEIEAHGLGLIKRQIKKSLQKETILLLGGFQ
jgi:hypothetical protein